MLVMTGRAASRTLHPLIRSRAAFQQQSRFFITRPHRFRISGDSSRPQLPFLHSISSPNVFFRSKLARFLTTESQGKLSDYQKLWIKALIASAGVTAASFALKLGIQHRKWERQHPEPPDWSWQAQWDYRTALGMSFSDQKEAIIPWVEVGERWKQLIERLEDPKRDGAGLKPRLGEGEELSVAGIGPAGLDITAKSETWRRGYYEALMGLALTAEHLDGLVLDTTRGKVFPPEVVIGPSNRRPKPVPFGLPDPPKEENCVQAFEDPQVYYMRILTTEGFSTRQRLDAALSYADFLQSKQLSSSAGDMYDWAMDIAKTHADPSVIDNKTGALADTSAPISENIMLAASALAMHKAQIGDYSTALPMYLSILRAQRLLPEADPAALARKRHQVKPTNNYLKMIENFFTPPPYPEAPPSGDETATRTPTASCDEAATMAHIGEILYASGNVLPKDSAIIASKSQEAGLSWTRDAFDLAMAVLESVSNNNSEPPLLPGLRKSAHYTIGSETKVEAKARCVECLAMAMNNWRAMVRSLRKAEIEKRVLAATNPPKKPIFSWLWSFSKPQSIGDEPGKWELEEQIVALKDTELRSLLRREGMRLKESTRFTAPD